MYERSRYTEDKIKESKLILIIAFFLQFIVIHQFSIYQTLINEPGFTKSIGEAYNSYKEFMLHYGGQFRTFTHRTIHRILTGLFLVTSIITIKALFERFF